MMNKRQQSNQETTTALPIPYISSMLLRVGTLTPEMLVPLGPALYHNLIPESHPLDPDSSENPHL